MLPNYSQIRESVGVKVDGESALLFVCCNDMNWREYKIRDADLVLYVIFV